MEIKVVFKKHYLLKKYHAKKLHTKRLNNFYFFRSI